MRKTLLMIVALGLAAGLTACAGGSTTAVYELGHVDARWTSWDPQAPVIEVPVVGQALSQAQWVAAGAYQVTALDRFNAVDRGVLGALRLEARASELVVWADQPLAAVSLYVRYAAADQHLVGVAAERARALSLAQELEPGLVAIGVAAIGAGRLSPRTPLARLSFAAGPSTAVRAVSKITQDPRAKIVDITATDNGSGDVTLDWAEIHPGDYDNNGLVTINDLTPLGREYQEVFDTTSPRYAQLVIIDGIRDGELNIQDVTPIGQNMNSQLIGYNVYYTELTAEDEMPDPAENPSRWTKLENNAAPNGPSAPREWNDQLTQVTYTFLHTPGNGSFGWYVAPVGPAGSAPEQGAVGSVVTLKIGGGPVPEALLSFEIQAPSSSLLNLNDEFYVAVKITGVTGLFSANVRFEYDANLVEYLEGVASYPDHPNLLSIPPVFLAADNVGTAESPYVLLGFNGTQTQGTAVKDGDGALGYFKFRAKAAGVNPTAFRFPQSSNFILLWGDQYGVPCNAPTLGPGQAINIAE